MVRRFMLLAVAVLCALSFVSSADASETKRWLIVFNQHNSLPNSAEASIMSSTTHPWVRQSRMDLLLRMAEDEGGDRITRKLTHHTIAQMIGASRETVSRTMRDFQNQGWINVERRRIALADRAALKRCAQARV